MICIYDLYDLYSILVGIRFCPQNKINQPMLSSIIDVLKDREGFSDFNQFRKAIQHVVSSDDSGLYGFASVENKYTYLPIPVLKDDKIYDILIKALESLSDAISEENEEKIYDLADCLHNLPIIIAENRNTIPKRFWKNEIRSYRLKWDASFLIDEHKLYTKKIRKQKA